VLRLAADGLNDAAREGYAANGRGWQRVREALRALSPEPLIACWQDLVSLDLRGVLPGIDRPCLLVHGGRSNFYPVQTAYWVQRQTPGARLSIHEEGNHSPHLMDPKRFVAELAQFVASGSAAGCAGR
jgi:pimeloyl-ACP methyl ester carboxylesterase